MPFVCQNCGYVSQERIDECPDCGGFVEEKDPEIDWLGEGGGGKGIKKKRENNESKNL